LMASIVDINMGLTILKCMMLETLHKV